MSLRRIHFLFCLLVFGLVFFMRDTVSFAGWAAVECACAVLLIIEALRKPELRIPAAEFLTPAMLLLLWACASLLWSANFHATWTGFLKMLLGLGAVVLFQNDPEEWSSAVRFSLLTVSLAAALVVAVLMPGTNLLLWLKHPNLYAGFVAAGGVAWADRVFETRGASRLRALAASALVLFALLSMAALGPFLAWLAGCAFLLRGRGYGRIGAAAAAVLALLAAVWIAVSFSLGVGQPLLVARKLSDPFAAERVRIWRDAAVYFLHHPLIGTGLGTFRDYYPQYKTIAGLRNAPYAHDEPLNLLCELGLAGGALAAWLAVRLLGFARRRGGEPGARVWTAVACGIAVQSLFDFNLHYPLILLLAAFCVSVWVPQRTVAVRKAAAAFLLAGWAALSALPGWAEVVFRTAPDDPVRRAAAARLASRLDPFNAFYRSQTGRMRDLLVAIELEPRNVWYRREAARFYASLQPPDLDAAIAQYEEIVRLAPQVPVFRQERDALLREKEGRP